MANKVTRLFRKNRQFPKVNTEDTSDVRELVRQIDERLTVVEAALKELMKNKK